MNRVLIADIDNCTGCRICELACSMENHREYNPQKSLIRVLRHRDLDVNIPVLAIQCIKESCQKCVEFCPTKCLRFTTLKEGALIRKKAKMGSIPVPLFGDPLLKLASEPCSQESTGK